MECAARRRFGSGRRPIGVNLRKWGVRAVEIQAGFFGEFKFKFKFKLALKKPGSGHSCPPNYLLSKNPELELFPST